MCQMINGLAAGRYYLVLPKLNGVISVKIKAAGSLAVYHFQCFLPQFLPLTFP
jgi:hypothetical protein